MTMNNQHIVILGGFGRVGIEAARYLLNNTQCRVTLASRQQHLIPSELKSRFSERVARIQLDVVKETQSLKSICDTADVLISCIGPSGIIGDRVAKICKQTATPLVDAGGYDPVIKSLDKDELKNPSPVPIIINVGLLPGLSGAFPKYILDATAKGRKVSQLDVQYVGRDAWSYNSAWDIIYGLGDFGDEKGFCYFEDNDLVKVSMFKAGNKAEFPEPIGKVSTMLLHAEEIVRLARSFEIRTAKVFGANIGPRATFICVLAKLFRLYNTPSGIDRAARWLVKASKKDMRKLKAAYAIQVDVEYESGELAQGKMALADTYEATGTVIGITAKNVIEGEITANGVFMLHEAVKSERFMQQLEQSGILTLNSLFEDDPAQLQPVEANP